MTNYIEQDDQVGLRDLKLEDSATVVAWRNQERVRKNYLYNKKFTIEGQEKYFHEMVETGKVRQFVICDLEDGAEIGCTVLSSIDREKKQAEVGIFIGSERGVGKGYAQRALYLAMRHAFCSMGIEVIVAKVFADNTASNRAAVHSGLICIGESENVPDAEGNPHRMKDYRLEKATFMEQKRIRESENE